MTTMPWHAARARSCSHLRANGDIYTQSHAYIGKQELALQFDDSPQSRAGDRTRRDLMPGRIVMILSGCRGC